MRRTYEYYQQARERRRGLAEIDHRRADRLASQAIELDPAFAEAWALKAVIASELYWFYYDRSDSIVAAVDELSRRALELAPRDASAHEMVCETRTLLREYEAAEAACRRAVQLRPDFLFAYHQLAQVRISAAGDTAGARRLFMDARSGGDARQGSSTLMLYDLELLARNSGAALEEVTDLRERALNSQFRYLPRSLASGFARRIAGETEAARAAFDSARAELQALVDEDPTEPRYRSALGLALAGLGRDEPAIREGEEGVRLMPPEKEAWRGTWRVADLARIYAMTGRADDAVERLEYLLSVPSDLSAWTLRLDPAWDPLRGNPRFQALVGGE